MSLFQVQGLAKWSGQGSVEEASKQEDAAAKEVREDGERPLLLVVQELTSEVARYKEKWSAVVVCCSRYKEKCLLIDPRQKYGQILRSRKQLPVTYKNDYVRKFRVLAEILGLMRSDGIEIQRCYLDYLEALVSHYKAARSSRNPTGGYEGIRRFEDYHGDGNMDGVWLQKKRKSQHFGITLNGRRGSASTN
ncbi:hypothetical protein Tco_1182391 [Tanacetum coccineum]